MLAFNMVREQYNTIYITLKKYTLNSIISKITNDYRNNEECIVILNNHMGLIQSDDLYNNDFERNMFQQTEINIDHKMTNKDTTHRAKKTQRKTENNSVDCK